MRSNNNGFTLIEMLISVTILAMVLTLSYQAFGLYLKNFGSTKSLISGAQTNLKTQLKLRYSIASMMDYYVDDGSGETMLLLSTQNNTLRYASNYSILGFGNEVVTTLAMNEQQPNELVITECDLAQNLILSISQQIEQSSCRSEVLQQPVSDFTITAIEAKPIITFDDISESYVEAEAQHLLPRAIKVSYTYQETQYQSVFRTHIRNLPKYKRQVVEFHQVGI